MQPYGAQPAPKLSSLRIYLRLLSYLRPMLGWFAVSLIGFIIFASAQPMLAGVLKYFVDGLTLPANSTQYNFPVLASSTWPTVFP